MVEIERRWLIPIEDYSNVITTLSWGYDKIGSTTKEVLFLSTSPYIRISGDIDTGKADLCIKGGTGQNRTEIEKDLTTEEFKELYGLVEEEPILKQVDQYALLKGLILEVQTYTRFGKTIRTTAEVEFTTETEAKQFKIPVPLQEITDDQSYNLNTLWITSNREV